MRARPSVLIFDLDGTLLDSMPALARIFNDIVQEQLGVSAAVSNEIYYQLAGQGVEPQFREVLRRGGNDDESRVHSLSQEFWNRAADFAPAVFPDVPPALEALKRQGYAMFVSSGGLPAFARQRAAAAGIDGYFRLVLGTDRTQPGMAKGPGHFRRLADALGLNPDAFSRSSWLVGDGAFDMQVARAAGIFAVGRLTGKNTRELRQAGADAVIEDLTGLLALLDDSSPAVEDATPEV